MLGVLFPEVDKSLCLRLRIVPLQSGSDGLRVYHDGSSNLSIFDHLKFVSGHWVEPVCVTPGEVDQLLADYFPSSPADSMEASNSKTNKQSAGNSSNGVVAVINGWIEEAISLSASDIHVEPLEDSLAVRYRIDGALQQRYQLSGETVPETLSRLKIMAGLDIAEKRRPQDGRIRYQVGTRTIDIRLSIIPTDFGEKAVLRVLDKASLNLDLDRIGFLPDQAKLFREAISLPNGIVLVTGPTGSGKTTTLYAASLLSACRTRKWVG